MSKLKLILLATSFIAFTGFQQLDKSVSSKNSDTSHHLNTPDQEIWGKTRGPILVKIEATPQKNSVIAFKGLVKSQKENISTEWKLPEGAVVLSGDIHGEISKIRANEIAEMSIVIDLSQAKDEPIIFTAYIMEKAERFGHSRAYKWNKTAEDIEHVEKIRLKLKDRKSKFVK